MANFCIPQFAADKFKAKLKDGSIDPQKLADMTSTERRDFLADILGKELAPKVNAEFESKLLLKNQQQGILNWAKKTAGLTPEAKRDIIDRVGRMTEILNPENKDRFFEDLAERKLGTHVTEEEAGKIAELAQKVQDAKEATPGSGGGMARVEFSNYVSDIKNAAGKKSIGEMVKDPLGTATRSLKALPGFTKSLKASFDDSAIFRQGWKTMFTNPVIWQKNARQSFVDLVRQFGGKEVMNEVKGEILSRPTYDLMKKAKLAIGTTEEEYPSHIVEKVYGLGRAYKASEAAYTGFVYRQRADIFDKYLEIAKKSGVDITDKEQLESIGKLVNSLTGRGHLGSLEGKGADAINNIFFSPRFLKSNIDFLTAHQFQKGVTPFVRKQAAENLVKAIGGMGLILSIANAIKPGSVELDPRSSDFGKIKIGDTRFDVSGGMASILTLAAKLSTLSSKSSTTGKVTELNSGKYGSQTGLDTLMSFGEGKLSPVASIAKDILKGQDFNGNKPTVLGEANNLLTPLPITNYLELKNDPNSAGVLAGTIADALGISTNTFVPKKK